jgi:hypothetical protein
MSAVAWRNDLIARGCPLYTGDVSCHHIIIIMEIDADVMAKLPNNQPQFGCPLSARIRLAGELVGLNGMELSPGCSARLQHV